LRQKWSAAGKAIKTEKIRDVEFFIVPLTTNDVPQTLRKLLPQSQELPRSVTLRRSQRRRLNW
jgi:hypothetical protein